MCFRRNGREGETGGMGKTGNNQSSEVPMERKGGDGIHSTGGGLALKKKRDIYSLLWEVRRKD